MNKDNIQELLKPRYLVSTPWYPSNNYQSGDIVTPDKFTGWHPKYSPVIFRRLEWWEDRDVKDMPEYVSYVSLTLKDKYGDDETKTRKYEKVTKWHFGKSPIGICSSDPQWYYNDNIFCTLCHSHLPATETEYLNQTNQP